MPSEIQLLQHGLTHSHNSAAQVPGCTCSVELLSMVTHFEVLQHDLMNSGVMHRHFKVYQLQHGFIHSHRCFEIYLLHHAVILGPQCLQRCICCSTDTIKVTGASRCICSAWAYLQLQMLQGVLLPHGPTHRSQSLQLKFTLEFQPVLYSSTETAVKPWPSASPGTWPLLLSECSQAERNKTISSTAVPQEAKAKSSH